MSLVTWQDLCFDALDVDAQSRFWAAVTGLTATGSTEHRRLEGPTPRHTIWINQVDRPHRVKNRIHPDVDCGSVADLVALGATVVLPAAESGFAWTQMADPEGNEFCAFERTPDRLPDYRLHGLGIDCVDAERLAHWWGDLLGTAPVAESGDHGDSWWTITGAASDDRMTLDFGDVPEPRSEPHRVHWDVVGSVDDLLARGASYAWEQPSWTVLTDPEGNEFCVFAPR